MNSIHSALPPTARRVFAEPHLGCAAVSRNDATDVLMLQYQSPDRPVEDAAPLPYKDLYAAVHAHGDQAAAAEVRLEPAGARVAGVTTMNEFVFGPKTAQPDARFEIVGGELWYVGGQG